jgi:small subunit ribosomal protein S16
MQRIGRSRRPFYRIQVLDHRVRRDGASIEQVGWYDPIAKDPAKQVKLNEERVKYWIGVGAQPSETVKDMLAKRNLIKLEAWEARRARDRRGVEERAAKAAAAPAEGEKKAEAPKAEAAKEEKKAE